MKIDWEQVYETFDGTMENCPGKDCETPCCAVKTVATWGQGNAVYLTTFFDLEEKQIQQQNIDQHQLSVRTVDLALDRVSYQILVSQCLDGEQCKLVDLKPFACRLYPFKLEAYLPINTKCPSFLNIASNKEIVQKILHIRELLGFKDNHLWQHQLQQTLGKAQR